MRLDGKVALISGGAHGVKGELMGFGGASAWMFTREGAKVVLGDIDVERGEKTVSQVRESGGEAIFVRLDVTSESDWAAAVRTTVDRMDEPIQALFHIRPNALRVHTLAGSYNGLH